MRFSLFLVLILAALLVAAGCSDGSNRDDALSSTTIVLDWFPNADHASLYTAQAQGLFDSAGLEVDLSVPSDPAAALKQVAANRADFAISYEPEVLLARSQGVPVTAVAAIISQPLNSVIARTDRAISRPRDLEGKTVGATGLPSDTALLETVVRADGGDPTKVKVANVGFTLGPAIASGKVDALIGAYWNIEVPEIEDKGVDVGVFRLEEFGVPDYDELVLVTSDRVIAERPELVRRLIGALQAGALAALDDPEAATAAVVGANPDLDDGLVVSQVEETVALLAPTSDLDSLMAVNPGEWATYAQWMREEGLLTKPLTVSDAVDGSFVGQGGG